MTDQPQPADHAAPTSAAGQPAAGTFEGLGRRIDALPHVQAAERLLHQAHEELRRAQAHYQRVRSEAASELHTLREKNVADLVETSLDYVRRHPGQGVLGSVLLGLFLGRVFRR